MLPTELWVVRDIISAPDGTTLEFWVRLLSIVTIDLALAGDNALVIAMAVRTLPRRQQSHGRVWGSLAAVALRLVLIAIVSLLLAIPFLQLVGGLFLLWIAIKLMQREAGAEGRAQGGGTLFDAIRIIAVADVVMSLDNVLAVAAVAERDFLLIVIGIGLSLPLVVWGSGILARLMNRHRWILWIGGGILGYASGAMMLKDPAVHDGLGTMLVNALHYPVPITLGTIIFTFGWLFASNRRRARYSLHRIRWRSGLCVGVFLLMLAGPGSAESLRFWLGARSSTGFTVPIAPGISYSRYRVVTSPGPLSIHHLSLNLSTPSVRLGVSLAHNQLISQDETVSSMARRSGAVAGVNGDFFDIGDSGMPLNIVVQDGQLLRSPAGRAALAIGKDGSTRIGRYRWNGSILLPTTNVTHWIAGFNTGLASEGIVVLSKVRGYGAPVPGHDVRQTVVELVPVEKSRHALVMGSTVLMSFPYPNEWIRYTVNQVWPQQAYYAPFPKGMILLVGRGRAADWLTRNVAAGIPIHVKLATIPDWRRLHGAIGGGPVLVQNGRVVDDPHSPVPHERNHRNPVLAVGISRDRQTMLLVGVDGRQPRRSIGLTQPQLAAYMQRLGAYEAMAFDSGGSVTMVARLPGRGMPTVVNSPSDGRERAVANALLVFSTSGNPRRR